MSTLDDALEKWSVLEDTRAEGEVGDTPNWPPGWWAVVNDDGIVAYFGSEVDANRWRLSMVNRELNP